MSRPRAERSEASGIASKSGSAKDRRVALAPAGSPVALLAELPEEDVWLAGLQSERTARAYKADVSDFVAALGIASREELYAVPPAAVIAWRKALGTPKSEGGRGLKNTTVARKLSALSSLFEHLVEQHLTDFNPVAQVKRPRRARRAGSGKTPTFSQEEARQLLDAPPTDTVAGLRDRAILSVGFQAGLRRAEIAHLVVGDVVQHQGMACLRFVKKGGDDHLVPLNPNTKKRIDDYLAEAGHGDDVEGPLFRPLRGNQFVGEGDLRRHLEPDMIDKVVRKWTAKRLGHTRGFSAHSMRATFITRALENGCSLERVQRDVGHAHPSTTQIYDHRGDNPEEAATFFANY